MVRLELSAEFVSAQHVPLTAEDLAVGLRIGVIKPTVATELARTALQSGAGDDETVGPGSADSLRRWLFLQLSALWEVRGRLADPLGAVEEVYADFDYPEVMAPFVRYMPAAPGAATGEAAILAAWRDYLEREATALRSGPG